MGTAATFVLEEEQLSNGLRVVVSPDHASPVVSLNIVYKAGGRDDPPGQSGMAHLFEHLTFRGSPNLPDGQHMALVQEAGGRSNGITSFDRTSYDVTLHADDLELALWLESERMGGHLDVLGERELRLEKDVVASERRRTSANPFGDVLEEVLPRLFPPDHPYHYSVMGLHEDVEGVSLEDARAFFRKHYAPNNAVACIAGDVDPEVAFPLVEKHFGHIPGQADLPESVDMAPDGPLDDEVRASLPSPVPSSALFLGYRVPPVGGDDYLPLTILRYLLAANESAMLNRRLQDERALASRTSMDLLDLCSGSSIAMFSLLPSKGVSLDELCAAFDEEIAAFKVTEEAVAAAKGQLGRAWGMTLDTPSKRADELARRSALYGTPTGVHTVLARLHSVTVDAVQEALRLSLGHDRRVLLSYQSEEGA